jgi:hypothetical protein
LALFLLDPGMDMRRSVPLATALITLLAACSTTAPSGSRQATPSASVTPFPAAYDRGATYQPPINPTTFVDKVDNPYFPLVPGTRWVLKAHGADAGETTITQVTSKTKLVMGIRCTVVRDEVDAEGRVKELTFDWYAQDSAGNVWYMGEDTAEYTNGNPSREGSWEAGVGGAQPGIIMPASPIVELTYRQEFLKGSAEDLAKVVDTTATADTPFRSFGDVWVTEDWTPLEPTIVERKFYARGVGLVMEQLIKGGRGTNALTDYSAPN